MSAFKQENLCKSVRSVGTKKDSCSSHSFLSATLGSCEIPKLGCYQKLRICKENDGCADFDSTFILGAEVA